LYNNLKLNIMDSKTKKIFIISGAIAAVGAIIGIIIYMGKKSSPTTGTGINPVTGKTVTTSGIPTSATGTAINPVSGAKVTTTQAANSTPGVATNPWIRFNWTGGNNALQYNGTGYDKLGYIATGFQLSNISELPKALGPGTKVEIKMEPASQQNLNGIHTVLYLGEDTHAGDFMNGSGIIVVDFPVPSNPNNLPKSGYFRVV